MSKKIVWMTALGVFCGFFLSAIFTGRGIPLIGVIGTTIGICIVMFWMKLKVTPEMLSQGKKKFRFSEGTVVFEKVSPLMSWFMFFKGNGEAIVFKPFNGGRVQKIYFCLTPQNEQEVKGLLAQYNTVPATPSE